MNPLHTQRRLPWLGVLAAWALWGAWSAQQSALAALLAGESIPMRTNPLSLTFVSASFWAAVTPVVMIATRRIRDTVATSASRALAHVMAFLLVHLLDSATYWLATGWLTGTTRPFLALLFSLVTFNALTYTAIAVIITALDAGDTLRERHARESQLEGQLALAQFHALRAQLHPHFLFNALNAVSSLIHSNPGQADRMLTQVSDLLRTAIRTAEQAEVPLRDEMEFNSRYLDVERMRYGERLDVRIDMAGETLDALVPNMLLQPLVENAVRHGIAPHSGHGRVEVHSSRRGHQLCLIVRDTGAGFDMEQDDGGGSTRNASEQPGSPGVGIATTRARLQTLYGDQQELILMNTDGGFEARVLMPFHRRHGAVA